MADNSLLVMNNNNNNNNIDNQLNGNQDNNNLSADNSGLAQQDRDRPKSSSNSNRHYNNHHNNNNNNRYRNKNYYNNNNNYQAQSSNYYANDYNNQGYYNNQYYMPNNQFRSNNSNNHRNNNYNYYNNDQNYFSEHNNQSNSVNYRSNSGLNRKPNNNFRSNSQNNNYNNQQQQQQPNNNQEQPSKAQTDNNKNNNHKKDSQNKAQRSNKNDKTKTNDLPKTSENKPPKEAKPPKENKQPKKKDNQEALKNLSRSEILIDQLKKHKCECMVCYQFIRNEKPIWSCNICFHIFHLSCIKKWASSPAAKIDESDKWRCPGCQHIINQIPNKYICFCTKKVNPNDLPTNENGTYINPNNSRIHLKYQIPHSCGEVCGKPLIESSSLWLNQNDNSNNTTFECKHKCVQICHPGPCATCETLVTRSCNCGKAKFQVKCNSTKIPDCDKVCDNLLNCKLHKCELVCHSGSCESCQIDVEQECYSHSNKRIIKCGDISDPVSSYNSYSCKEKCNKLLACGNHYCSRECHTGECETCLLTPSKLTKCPCGKTQVRELLIKNKIIRTSCLDAVPTCANKCSKQLSGCEHFCEANCHTGECPPCEKIVDVKCRCGKESDTIKCADKNNLKLCDRRCQKKKSCSRHQCNEICCNDTDHICMQICYKMLNCGNHKCEELCHKGPCQRCLIASFEERICNCGSTIQYPPIRCGTKPLECNQKCTRQHNCEHPVAHSCHWEEKCPPCSYLTSKMCMGNHEMRHNIPCHMKDVSCGKPCDRPLPNCSHKCQRTCHKGDCLDAEAEVEVCTQQCLKERPHCSHSCGSPCHGNEQCPDTICQSLVLVKCKCGLRSKQVKCQQRMYDSTGHVVFENLASQIKEMLSTKSIDVNSFKNEEILKKKYDLECNVECLIAERNNALAQVLLNEASSRPKPVYSDFLRDFARSDLAFVIDLENKFEILIKECKDQTSRSTKKLANLPIMKSIQRKFIHELASHYGLETQSQDPEPYRNVLIYANKEKCFLPNPLLSQVVENKLKQASIPRLVNYTKPSNPAPKSTTLHEPEQIQISSAFSVLADEKDEDEQFYYLNSKNTKISSKEKPKSSENVIDYFDMTDDTA